MPNSAYIFPWPWNLKDLFYREGWEYILEKHGGRLPVKIKAVSYPIMECVEGLEVCINLIVTSCIRDCHRQNWAGTSGRNRAGLMIECSCVSISQWFQYFWVHLGTLQGLWSGQGGSNQDCAHHGGEHRPRVLLVDQLFGDPPGAGSFWADWDVPDVPCVKLPTGKIAMRQCPAWVILSRFGSLWLCAPIADIRSFPSRSTWRTAIDGVCAVAGGMMGM